MRVLLVSAIFPPDIGGPATHAADLRAELRARGHEVTVLALTDEGTPTSIDGLVRLPRSWPWPWRATRALIWIARHRRDYDIVYATGLTEVAVAGARAGGLPVVAKIVGDPAWERGVRRGQTTETFDAFQRSAGGGLALRAMRALRNWSVRRATIVITPSEHLRGVVERWGAREVVVVPNGVRQVRRAGSGESTRPGILDLVYVGRLVVHKRVDILIEAVARTSLAHLDVVGDGPEADYLRERVAALGADARVRFLGSLDHDGVMQRLASADALVLASSYEGLPHVVLEALASGTPVVAPAIGGVAEILGDGVDSVIVEAATPESFARAFEQLAADRALLGRLREGAAATGEHWTLGHCVDRIEALLEGTTARVARAVFVGKSRTSIPLPPDQQQKYAIHGRHLRTIVICTGGPGRIARSDAATVVALPDLPVPFGTVTFYAAAPVIALALTAGRRTSAIVCQSPYEGFGVLALRQFLPASARPRVQVELHGDWRTAARLYGSSRRRFMASASDRAAVWALRRADRVRAVSNFLVEMARDAGYDGPIDRFIAFSQYGTFLDTEPRTWPEKPHVLFVGVLERYKGVDVLLDAWRAVAAEIPQAQLTIVGAGSCSGDLGSQARRAHLDDSVRFVAPLPRAELRDLIDASSFLVLPSRSEGLGRIVLEAMARARAVVGSAVGGIVELVDDGTTGLLVTPESAPALGAAIIELLRDPERARHMGEEGRHRAIARDPIAEYNAGIARLATWICGT